MWTATGAKDSTARRRYCCNKVLHVKVVYLLQGLCSSRPVYMDALPLFQHWGREKMAEFSFLALGRKEKNGGFLPSIRERNMKHSPRRKMLEVTFLALGRET